VLGLYLARSIAGGLRSMAHAAAGLAAGEVDQRVDVFSRDELGAMAEAFREVMAYNHRLATIADAVAAGRLDVQVKPISEFDRLGGALRRMVANLRQQTAEREQAQ